MNSRKYLVIVLIILIVLYVNYYFTPNKQFEIIQLSLEQLTGQHLLEKSPILITDNIVNPLSLLSTAFAYLYMFKKFKMDIKEIQRHKSQYLILTAIEDSVITILHPLTGKFDNMEMIVDKGQTLVLPYKWSCKVESGKANSIDLDTVASYIFKFISK